MRSIRHLSFLGLFFLALAAPLHATWSIVAIDVTTGEIAVASATCLTGLDLQQATPVVIVGVGAAAAQSAIDAGATNRMRIHRDLLKGMTPQQILRDLRQHDLGHQGRQYGIVAFHGGALTFTGNGDGAWAGGVTGQVGDIVYAIQGNVLTGQPVVGSAESAFVNTPGDLSTKVIAAMEAAASFGGDGRCSCDEFRPTSCGSPPPSFTKSAHVGYLIVSRPGDVDGVCEPQPGCANGDYYLDINIKRQHKVNPDPVLQMRGQYDIWRAAQAGRPDAFHSTVFQSRDSVSCAGGQTITVVIDLADIDGVSLNSGGAQVSMVHAPRSAGLSSVLSVQDNHDGTYEIELDPGAGSGIDLMNVVVDDGIRPVQLGQPVKILHFAPPVPSFNNLTPIAGLDGGKKAADRNAFLLPDGTTAWVLSDRKNGIPRLGRMSRPAPNAPFQGFKPVPGLDLTGFEVQDFWVSPDQMRVYWSGVQTGAAASQEKIFLSERPDPGSPFDPPLEVEELNGGIVAETGGPWLTDDELEIYFHSKRPLGKAGFDLFHSTRLEIGGQWFPPEIVDSVSTSADEFNPMLVDNGTRLLFSRAPAGGVKEVFFGTLKTSGSFHPDCLIPGSAHGAVSMEATSSDPATGQLWITQTRLNGSAVLEAQSTSSSLAADEDEIRVAAGGTVNLTLEAGPGWAQAPYAVFAGASGMLPEGRIRFVVVPLAFDLVTMASRRFAGRIPFLGFQGDLDVLGRGSARLFLPPGLPVPPEFIGRTLRMVFLSFQGRHVFVSNAVEVDILP